MKVYCNDCKCLNFIHRENPATKKRSTETQCVAPQNKKTEDSPLGPVVTLERTPEVINANNDCKWFVPSRPKTSREKPGPTVGMKTILDHEGRIKMLEQQVEKIVEIKKVGRPPKKIGE